MRACIVLGIALLATTATARAEPAAFDYAAAGRVDRLQKELARDPQLLNTRNAQGETLLLVAAAKNQRRIIAVLLMENKADADATGADGATALHRAAAEGNLETASLLVALGAGTHVKDRTGRTPGELARRGGYASLADLLDNAICAMPPAK